MAQGFPYDGWYNGHGKLMIANGTYADYRGALEERLRLRKLKPEQLEAWDKEWALIPTEEKLRRRAIVVQDNTPQPVEFVDQAGKKRTVYRSTPSDNNNLDPEKNRRKGQRKLKRPLGALTDENNPILSESSSTTLPTK